MLNDYSDNEDHTKENKGKNKTCHRMIEIIAFILHIFLKFVHALSLPSMVKHPLSFNIQYILI